MVGQPRRNFTKMASWSRASEHLVNPIGMSDQLKWNNHIGELTKKAQVSRNSFYRNYTDREDIIKKYFYQLLSEWDNSWKQQASDSNSELFGHLFMYLKQYSDILVLIQKRGLFYLFKESYLSIYGPLETMDNITAYTLVFIANGILGWIEEWIKRGMCESAETMTSLLNMNGML